MEEGDALVSNCAKCNKRIPWWASWQWKGKDYCKADYDALVVKA